MHFKSVLESYSHPFNYLAASIYSCTATVSDPVRTTLLRVTCPVPLISPVANQELPEPPVLPTNVTWVWDCRVVGPVELAQQSVPASHNQTPFYKHPWKSMLSYTQHAAITDSRLLNPASNSQLVTLSHLILESNSKQVTQQATQ